MLSFVSDIFLISETGFCATCTFLCEKILNCQIFKWSLVCEIVVFYRRKTAKHVFLHKHSVSLPRREHETLFTQ